jgi:antitoxin YqcF
VTSYGTVGLSDYPLLDRGTEYPARCELVGACASRYQRFGNIISSCAFNIMKDQEFAYPGRIFGRVVAMYYRSLQMRHVMFTQPFPWDEELGTAELPGKTVAFLLAVPISDAELQYARSFGAGALGDAFEREQIDIFDLERHSVVLERFGFARWTPSPCPSRTDRGANGAPSTDVSGLFANLSRPTHSLVKPPQNSLSCPASDSAFRPDIFFGDPLSAAPAAESAIGRPVANWSHIREGSAP